MQRIREDLWTAWSSSYLQSLYARSKWQRPTNDFQVGDVVIIKDEMLKQRSWLLARITQVYPGSDGHIRAVDLRCQGKVYRRSAHRLVLVVEDQHACPPVCPGFAVSNPNNNKKKKQKRSKRSRPHPLHELIRTLIINLPVLLCHPFSIPPKTLNSPFTNFLFQKTLIILCCHPLYKSCSCMNYQRSNFV